MATTRHIVAAVAFAAFMLGLSVGLVGAQQPQSPPVGAQPSPQPAPTSGGQPPGVTIASDSLVGTKVRDPRGNDIGHVSKLLIDPHDGKVASVLISRGGVLGMGGKEIAVPWSALKLQRDDQQRLVVTMQQSMLEQAPQPEPRQGPPPAGQPPAASPPTGSPSPQDSQRPGTGIPGVQK